MAVLDAGPGIPLVPLGATTLFRLACDALVEPATHCDGDRPPRTVHRFATARQRRALLLRDGGCAFPGCPSRRLLHAHHRRPWAEGGRTTLDNLVLACEHHHKLIHEGGWQLHPHAESNGQGGWLAVGPDGQRHVTAPPMRGGVRALSSAHTATIAAGTVTGHWAGESLDLDYAVGVLSQPVRVAPSVTAVAS